MKGNILWYTYAKMAGSCKVISENLLCLLHNVLHQNMRNPTNILGELCKKKLVLY